MTDIPAARKEIERIDAEIIRLVAARQECARVIGENKRAAGTNVFVPEREEALLRKLENIAAERNIPAASIRAIFREIISASVALQMDGLPVVYLGPEGTFTHQAARKNFGGSVRLQPLRTIAEIFEAVERGKAGYGVIPIENSNAGAVKDLFNAAKQSLKAVLYRSRVNINSDPVPIVSTTTVVILSHNASNPSPVCAHKQSPSGF